MALKSSYKSGVMLRPAGDPLSIPYSLDFSSASSIVFDLEKEQTLQYIDFVQSIFVSNYSNTAVLTITFSGGQVIHVPAGAEGYFPVSAEFGKFVVKFETTPTANLAIPVIFMNVPVASQQWGPLTVNVAGVTATFTPTAATATLGSQVAAASAQLFAANVNAKRRIVQNPAANLNPIYISFGGTAADATSFQLTPGQVFDTGTGPIDQTEWRVYAPANTTITKIQMV